MAAHFTKLLVWQKMHALNVRLHQIRIPSSQAPGLSRQLRRASASIAANIAEGAGKSHARFAWHVDQAIGSTREVECHLLLGRDLGVIRRETANQAIEDIIEIRRMLYGLLRHLNARNSAEAIS